jgi:hypothetical protein
LSLATNFLTPNSGAGTNEILERAGEDTPTMPAPANSGTEQLPQDTTK